MQRLSVKVFFGDGHSRFFLSQCKYFHLDGYCLYIRILVTVMKGWWMASSSEEMASSNEEMASSSEATQPNQEEKQENEEASLHFHPLLELDSSQYNLNAVSPAANSLGRHCSSNPNLHQQS
jgi:hypothetical protein